MIMAANTTEFVTKINFIYFSLYIIMFPRTEAYIFAILTLVGANVSADIIRYTFWKKKFFWTPTVCSIFTPMEAKYTRSDNSVPWYYLFDNN